MNSGFSSYFYKREASLATGVWRVLRVLCKDDVASDSGSHQEFFENCKIWSLNAVAFKVNTSESNPIYITYYDANQKNLDLSCL